jgi:L-aminopeptidase/D-esterase-like protein
MEPFERQKQTSRPHMLQGPLRSTQRTRSAVVDKDLAAAKVGPHKRGLVGAGTCAREGMFKAGSQSAVPLQRAGHAT